MKDNYATNSIFFGMITKPPEEGATLRKFICPNCGSEWICDHNDYEYEGVQHLYSSVDGSIALTKVTVKCKCPICKCDTIANNIQDLKSFLPEYKLFLANSRYFSDEETRKRYYEENGIPYPGPKQ